jgi:hypothetical protein
MTTTKKTPAQTEAEGVETTTLDWDGVAVAIPAEFEGLDPDVIEAFENNKAITACRAIMGSDQYDAARQKWAQKNGRRVVMGDIGRLFDAIGAAYGFESAGE